MAMDTGARGSEEISTRLARAERYLASDPGNPHLLADVIDLSIELGQLDRARQCADMAVSMRPDDVFMAHRRGTVLMAQGELEEAVATFRMVLSVANDAAVAQNLAYALFKLGKYGEARSVLEPHVAAGQAAPAMLTLLLRVLHHAGDIKEGVALARLQFDANASDAGFVAVVALLLLDDDQTDEADRLTRAILERGARPHEALVVQGSLALGRDDAVAATAWFGEAVAHHPDDGRSLSGLGMASLLAGETTAAKLQLERAVINMPAHIGTLHALAWCLVLRQEIDEAQTIFHRALALDRNFGESHGGLAVIHAIRGNKTEAEAAIARAQRLDPQGLSAKYAQMVLSGVTADPERFQILARRLLSTQYGPAGKRVLDAMARRGH